MSRYFHFSKGSWWQLELVPRIRLQCLASGWGLGIGWLPWWIHIWLWLRPAAPPAPPAPIGDRWYVCNSSACYWAGRLEDTVHPKHETEWVLCPECHETLTWFEPHHVVRLDDGSCHECGLPDLHEIHASTVNGDE